MKKHCTAEKLAAVADSVIQREAASFEDFPDEYYILRHPPDAHHKERRQRLHALPLLMPLQLFLNAEVFSVFENSRDESGLGCRRDEHLQQLRLRLEALSDLREARPLLTSASKSAENSTLSRTSGGTFEKSSVSSAGFSLPCSAVC
jgi:hypothetical protein